ncbi:hypothetical protein SBA4_6960002 [Candidatus Sulfopaludibacter sp. SbA4]|nr:hypothetical protein SBA4_6960002 [Candidatus Sulfopaludibacter sp. SbA4]
MPLEFGVTNTIVAGGESSNVARTGDGALPRPPQSRLRWNELKSSLKLAEPGATPTERLDALRFLGALQVLIVLLRTCLSVGVYPLRAAPRRALGSSPIARPAPAVPPC